MRTFRLAASLLAIAMLAVMLQPVAVSAEPAPRLPAFAAQLFADDFKHGLEQWHVEGERPGHISAGNGVLDIDVPAGATIWFRPQLQGRIAIQYDATAVREGGANDRVSDVNCFWMAHNRDGRTPVFAQPRTGKFAEYNDLLTYYVGLGGNGNTTTRFRRYIGDPVVRPLLPEHDLSTPDILLTANERQRITLIADGEVIQYWRDDRPLIRFTDREAYTQGWFALRTTQSHLRIERFRVYALPGQ